MGEMADEEIERSLQEWLENPYDEEYGQCWDPFAVEPSCKFCGRGELEWRNIGTTQQPKWRLYEKGKPHLCIKFKHHAK